MSLDMGLVFGVLEVESDSESDSDFTRPQFIRKYVTVVRECRHGL